MSTDHGTRRGVVEDQMMVSPPVDATQPRAKRIDHRGTRIVIALGVVAVATKGTATGLDLPALGIGFLAAVALLVGAMTAWRMNREVWLPPVLTLAVIVLGYSWLRSAGAAVGYQLLILCLVAFLLGVVSNQVSVGIAFRILTPVAWVYVITVTALQLTGLQDILLRGGYLASAHLDSGRFSGLSANPNGMVTTVALLTPLALASISSWPPRRGVALTALWVAIATPAVIASGSAQGIPALAVGVAVSLWRLPLPRLIRVAWVAVFSLAATPFIVSSETFAKLTREVSDDFSGRLTLWFASVDSSMDNLVFGPGDAFIFNSEFGVVGRSAHNGYLSMLLLGGVLGLGLALALLVAVYRNSVPSLTPVLGAFLVTLGVVNIASVVIWLPLVWLVMGASVDPARRPPRRGRPPTTVYVRHRGVRTPLSQLKAPQRVPTESGAKVGVPSSVSSLAATAESPR